MDDGYDIQRLLTLRKLTRALADLLRAQMKEYISTLAPLLRPKTVLGDYVQTSTKESTRGGDKAFKELQSMYEAVAGSKPFSLDPELKPPIEIINTGLEMTPMEYLHTAKTEHESKTVTVTSPLKWALTYSGFAPAQLRELLSRRHRDSAALKDAVVHCLVIRLVANQPGLMKVMEALHFPLGSETLPEFGSLPITHISSSVSTIRPPDHVIIESTEIAGRDAFEEIVNLDDVVKMRDPLKEQLIELIKTYGEHLLPQ
jgi:hypothetical protein